MAGSEIRQKNLTSWDRFDKILVSHEKRAPDWLGYFIGDDILPSYIGVMIKHYKDPY